MNRLSLFRKINNKFKLLVAKIVMLVLYRAIKVLAREDSRIMNEFLSWKDGLTVALEASPDGTAIYMQKYGDKLKRTKACSNVDIRITFRSVDAAFLVLTGQMGVARAYAEHRFMLNGDICQTMSLVRCIDIAESYLFPRLLTKRILRKVEKKEFSTLRVYRKIFVGV